jgi:NADPH:quinone reductase-like Zn-dependent oxidoreductase
VADEGGDVGTRNSRMTSAYRMMPSDTARRVRGVGILASPLAEAWRSPTPSRRQRLRVLLSSERAKNLELLRELVESGQVTPIVDRTLPLPDLPQAIRYLRG